MRSPRIPLIACALLVVQCHSTALNPACAQESAAGKEIEGTIRQYFRSMSKRDVEGLRAVLDTRLLIIEAAHPGGMRPCNVKALNDDYQGVRVLAEKEEYAELEAVVYPLTFNAEAIKGNRNWKKDYAGMEEHLAPGITANRDEAMLNVSDHFGKYASVPNPPNK